MVAAGRLLVVVGTILTAENATLGFDTIAGANDTDAIVAGALHHFDIDAHNLFLVYVVFGFKHVVHHVCQHGANVTVGQLIEDVSSATCLLQQSPRPQQT